jgi:hypothetical protein
VSVARRWLDLVEVQLRAPSVTRRADAVARAEGKKRAGHAKVLAHFCKGTAPRRVSGILAELLGARSETEASKSDGRMRILSSLTRPAFLVVAMVLLATLFA